MDRGEKTRTTSGQQDFCQQVIVKSVITTACVEWMNKLPHICFVTVRLCRTRKDVSWGRILWRNVTLISRPTEGYFNFGGK